MRYLKIFCLLAASLPSTAFAAQEPGQQPPAGQQRPGSPGRRPSFADIAGQMFTPGPPPDPAAVARGQKLFVPTCGFCHGPDATGKSGPDLVRSALVISDRGGDLIGRAVHDGRPGKGMPAFPGLNASQIADLSAFLHSRVRAAANRFAYNFREVVSGKAQAGETYFNGTGKCNTCHSPSGDLSGIARKFQPQDLQARMLYPGPSFFDLGRTKPPPPSQVTVILQSGQTVSGVLISSDELNVALRDSSGWYHSYPLQGAKIEIHDPLDAHKLPIGLRPPSTPSRDCFASSLLRIVASFISPRRAKPKALPDVTSRSETARSIFGPSTSELAESSGALKVVAAAGC